MVFKNLCVLVVWTKVALALEGLMVPRMLSSYEPVYFFLCMFHLEMLSIVVRYETDNISSPCI